MGRMNLGNASDANRMKILNQSTTKYWDRRFLGYSVMAAIWLFFRELIQCQDAEGLRDYAISCIDVVYTNATNYELPVTTISLVQGDALGGGFEAALAANVVVAERGCKMGLPEILFNLFPGMGRLSIADSKVESQKGRRFHRQR